MQEERKVIIEILAQRSMAGEGRLYYPTITYVTGEETNLVTLGICNTFDDAVYLLAAFNLATSDGIRLMAKDGVDSADISGVHRLVASEHSQGMNPPDAANYAQYRAGRVNDAIPEYREKHQKS